MATSNATKQRGNNIPPLAFSENLAKAGICVPGGKANLGWATLFQSVLISDNPTLVNGTTNHQRKELL
jgi:hypothetical protein